MKHADIIDAKVAGRYIWHVVKSLSQYYFVKGSAFAVPVAWVTLKSADVQVTFSPQKKVAKFLDQWNRKSPAMYGCSHVMCCCYCV